LQSGSGSGRDWTQELCAQLINTHRKRQYREIDKGHSLAAGTAGTGEETASHVIDCFTPNIRNKKTREA